MRGLVEEELAPYRAGETAKVETSGPNVSLQPAAAQSLAYVIAGPLIGWTIDRTHGYDGALVAVGLLVIPTSLAFAAWPGIPVERG